jgi:S-DNA-T family DNA segregation ATPase FtsK/SpoIIIE
LSGFVLVCLVARNAFFAFDVIAQFVSGLLGLSSYPTLLGLGMYGYFLIRQRKLTVSRSKFAILLCGTVALVLFLHVLSTLTLYSPSIDFNSYLQQVYELQLTIGGVLWGIVAFGVVALFSPIVASVVLFLAFLLCAYIFSDYGKSPKLGKWGRKKTIATPFVKGTVDNAKLVVPNANHNSLYVADIIKTQYNTQHNSIVADVVHEGQVNDRILPIQMSKQEYVNIPAQQQYIVPNYDSYNAEQYQMPNQYTMPTSTAQLYDNNPVDSRTKAQQLLFGNSHPLGKSSNNSLYSYSTVGTGYKPPKLSKIAPPIKIFEFPKAPDIEDNFVPGEIVNGDQISEGYDKVGGKTKKKTKTSSIMDRAYASVETEDFGLPPITNGELFGKSKASDPAMLGQVDVESRQQTPIVKASNFDKMGQSTIQQQPIATTNKPKLDTNTHNNYNSTLSLQDQDIVDIDSVGSLVLEDVYNPIAKPNGSGIIKGSSIGKRLYDPSLPFNDTSSDYKEQGNSGSIFDNVFSSGYVEYNRDNQDTSGIFDADISIEDVHYSADTAAPKIDQIEIEDYASKLAKKSIRKSKRYLRPNLSLLSNNSTDPLEHAVDSQAKGEALLSTLQSFGLDATIKDIAYGPAVTRFELEMPAGVPIKKIEQYTHDLAYNLESNGSIRIEMPIPGKKAVGIEVPNLNIGVVGLKDILDSKEFKNANSPLTLALGKDISGNTIVANLEKMPHLLIAGATGSGKSACINAIITSILFKASPDEVRLILIDPKRVELSVYSNLPHLIIKDILTEPNQAINALSWAINEMERRYKLLSLHRVRNIGEFNECKAVVDGTETKLPFVVIIVDELADLMMTNKKDVEDKIRSLAQKARAAGIHLIVATQRPSVDVITGTIKANLPSRIAFSVTNYQDSKTILDEGGAESLLGKGDMLYSPIDYNTPKRVQGAYITSAEVVAVVDYCKHNNLSRFDDNIEKEIMHQKEQSIDAEYVDYDDIDTLLPEVLRRVIETGQASTSMIQRHFRVGYARASRIVDQMEQRGYIGPLDGSRPREVKITKEIYANDFGDDHKD